MEECGANPGAIRVLQERFRDSGVPSIDFFLSFKCNADLEHLGKLAIASILVACEEPEKVRGDWYSELFYHLISPAEQKEPTRISIITFNYDQSLEFYLHRSARSTLRLTNAEATRWLDERVEILHVFGDLGTLPEWNAVKPHARFYGEAEAWHVQRAAGSIQIIGRDNAQSQSFSTAQQWISRAEFVCFLGFGFLDENTERLSLSALSNSVRSNGKSPVWFSSAQGLTHGRTAFLSSQFSARWIFGGEGEDAATFLRRTAFLHWAGQTNPSAEVALEMLSKHVR